MRALSVVVVAYGRADLLRDCLAPLAQTHDLVVVDNAGSSECAEICRTLGVRYVDPGGNLGFAAGVNVGLAQVATDHDVLLLNPDARIESEALARLHEGLEGDPRAACVAPAQVHPETGDRQRVEWPFPSPGREWLIALGLGRLVRAKDFVIGSVLLLDRDALDQVGAFDERYFLYSEETDWQRRAVAAGWHSHFVPDAVATHVGAATSSDTDVQEAHFFASGELYVRRWFGAAGWAAYRLAVIVGALPRLVVGGRQGRAAAGRRLRIHLRGPVRHRAGLLAVGGAR